MCHKPCRESIKKRHVNPKRLQEYKIYKAIGKWVDIMAYPVLTKIPMKFDLTEHVKDITDLKAEMILRKI